MAEFKPVTLEKWGGLNLADDEAEVGLNGAIDLLNVAFDRRGRVRTRDGYTLWVTPAQGAVIHTIQPYMTSAGIQHIVAGTDSATYAYTAATGAVEGSTLTYGATQVVNWGDPTTTIAYGVNGTANLLKWNGSAFSTVAGPGTLSTHIAVQPSDNRLVVVDATTGSGSKVWFSDAGDPATFGANNWVELTPGDGERITAILAWRDQLFVFKRSKFFVFYGNSTDSTGGAVFNYRAVATGRGAVGPEAVCVGTDGLYFLSQEGLYRTAGGTPELVSDAMTPLFRGDAGSFFTGDTPLVDTHPLNPSLVFSHEDRIFAAFVTVPNAFNSHTLVYDRRTGTWSLWDIGANGMAAVARSATTPIELFFADGMNVYRMASSLTDDNGTAITSRYRTGFFTPAGATVPSTIREVLLEGSGTVDVKASTDYGDLGTASAVSLGVSPAIAQNRAVAANYGRFHSYEFSSETGPFTLNRATFHVESKGPVGKQP